MQEARPGLVTYWYRQKPSPFQPSPGLEWLFFSIASGPVTPWNPHPWRSGEIGVYLDHRSRLEEFYYIPKPFSKESVSSGDIDWSILFELAGLDMAAFEPVDPGYQSYMVPDTRAAWVGATPGSPEEDLRVEAGAIEGRPVFFKLLDRSATERLGEEPSTWTGFGLGQLWEPGLTMLLILAACLLARRNLQKGRADRRGAIILSTFGFIAMCIHEGLRSHCLYNTHSLWELNRVLGSAVFMAIVVGAAYLALEPYARRMWPSLLVSWSRLTTGSGLGWSDPVVGRAILFGAAAGAAIAFSWSAGELLSKIIIGGRDTLVWADLDLLLGQRQIMTRIARLVVVAAYIPFFYTLLLLALRLVLRRTSLAIAAFIAIGMAHDLGFVEALGVGIWLPVSVATTAIGIVVLLRFGLIGLYVAMLVNSIYPLAATRVWTGWHIQPAIFAVLVFAALTAYGCWAATSGFRNVRQEKPG
jgi:hypothetical protein